MELPQSQNVKRDKEEQRAERAFAIDDVMISQIMAITAQLLAGVDITEIYSPRRVVEMAEQMGLRGGLSLDSQRDGTSTGVRTDERRGST